MFHFLLGALLIWFILYYGYRLYAQAQWKNGTRVVIIGASSGIGECLAKKLAAKGARLLLMARREEQLKHVAEQCDAISKSNGFTFETHTFVGDITSGADCQKVAEESRRIFGQVDILLLNAGISMDYSFDEMETIEDIKRIFGSMIDVNYFGNAFMAKAFAKQLEESGKIKI